METQADLRRFLSEEAIENYLTSRVPHAFEKQVKFTSMPLVAGDIERLMREFKFVYFVQFSGSLYAFGHGRDDADNFKAYCLTPEIVAI